MFVSSVCFSFWSAEHRPCWKVASQYEQLACKVFVMTYLVLKKSNTPAAQRAEPALVPSPLTCGGAGCVDQSVSPPPQPTAPAAPHVLHQGRQLSLTKIAALPALTGPTITDNNKKAQLWSPTTNHQIIHGMP